MNCQGTLLRSPSGVQGTHRDQWFLNFQGIRAGSCCPRSQPWLPEPTSPLWCSRAPCTTGCCALPQTGNFVRRSGLGTVWPSLVAWSFHQHLCPSAAQWQQQAAPAPWQQAREQSLNHSDSHSLKFCGNMLSMPPPLKH